MFTVSGEMRFSARKYKPKGHLGSVCTLAPRRDAGVGVVQAIVEGHDGRVGGLVGPLWSVN